MPTGLPPSALGPPRPRYLSALCPKIARRSPPLVYRTRPNGIFTTDYTEGTEAQKGTGGITARNRTRQCFNRTGDGHRKAREGTKRRIVFVALCASLWPLPDGGAPPVGGAGFTRPTGQSRTTLQASALIRTVRGRGWLRALNPNTNLPQLKRCR